MKTPEEFHNALTQLINDAKRELDTNDNLFIKTQENYFDLINALKRARDAAEFQVVAAPDWQKNQA